MAQDDVTKCLGLVTQYNNLGGAPGALILADDAVIRRENIIETRRGYTSYGNLGASATQLFVYNKKVLAQNGTSISYDGGSGTFSTFAGSYSPPTGYKLRSQEAVSNVYVTTSAGPMAFMDLSAPVTTTASSGSTTTSGVTTVPVTSATGIVVGWGVSGTGISSGTTVAAISGTTITLSATATITLGTSLTFNPTARKVGAPKCLDLSVATTAPTGSGIMSSSSTSVGTQCAYRAVVLRTDQNNNTLIGYPSPRAYISNLTGSGKDVAVTMYLSTDMQANDIVQFYRTTTVAYASGGTDGAGDEVHLVYSKTLTQSDIATGNISFTDIVVDSLASTTALLYTNPSQEGIGQANERPPLAKDIALYKSQYMFYANTTTKHRLYFTLLGTSSLTGKTITLAGITYNFGASEIISGAGSPQALVSATGVAANDIDLTARSLVRVINRYSSNTSVYAFYLSSGSDTPGQIMIEERGVGGSAFTLQASDSAISGMFNPAPPVSPSTTSTSTSSNNIQTNYLYYSKSQQPEAIPLLNYLPVGPSNRAILRIAPLRDSLIIVKEEGIYRLTGDTPSSFTVTLLDPTVFCKAADSVVVLNNSVFLLSNQGVVAVTDTGVQVVSREIEPNILPLLTYTNLSSYTSALAYDSERSYELSTMTSSTDTAPTQTYIYNVFTKTWTRKTYAFTAAIVEASIDKMYFVKSGDTNIYVERKTFSDSDYSDPEQSITIISVSGSTVVFSVASTVTPTTGYSISQGGTEIPISSVTTAGANWQATMSSVPPAIWTAGAATLYPVIQMTVKWNSWEGGSPALLKRIRQVAILTDDISGQNSLANVQLSFTSDLDQTPDTINVTTQAESWGDAWGDMAWGGTEDTYDYRVWPPKNKHYARLLTVGVTQVNANQKLSIAGVSYTFDVVSERTSK